MFSKKTDGGAKPRVDGSSKVPAMTEHKVKTPDSPRRAPPPPPRPGAADAKRPRPGPKVKPRPLDSLNVDLSDSRPPPNRSIVEDTAEAVAQRTVEELKRRSNWKINAKAVLVQTKVAAKQN